MQPEPGKLVIVSGPSGVGKSTIVRQVLAAYPDRLKLSVSATTRSPREGEVAGQHYYFLDREEFEARRSRGEFLEVVEVFRQGHLYGTLRSEVVPSLAAGDWVLLEIDVRGAVEILSEFPSAVSIFISPESLTVLEQRLRTRGTEGEEAIARRLAVAEEELGFTEHYRYGVVNTTIPEAVAGVCQILDDEGITND